MYLIPIPLASLYETQYDSFNGGLYIHQMEVQSKVLFGSLHVFSLFLIHTQILITILSLSIKSFFIKLL